MRIKSFNQKVSYWVNFQTNWPSLSQKNILKKSNKNSFMENEKKNTISKKKCISRILIRKIYKSLIVIQYQVYCTSNKVTENFEG